MSETSVTSQKLQNGRDKSLTREAQVFLDRKTSPYSRRAPARAPTLQEVQNTPFQEYVQSILFSSPEATKQGMAKVTLPQGFASFTNTPIQDTTARGKEWQQGSPIGDFMIQEPIKQCLSGIGGVYEYTLLDQKSLPLHEFQQRAHDYQQRQIGTIVSSENTISDDYCDGLAVKFWKRLGPTMEPSMYGADMEGSLFEQDEEASGWNPAKLESCLQLLSADTDGRSLPGVTTPYLYFGMWASVFCVHTEDMNLLSINYLHAGAPKYWYAIAPEYAKRFESLAESRFVHASQECKEFLRHKRYLLSPAVLTKAGVPYTTQIQRPGDVILTMPGAYHFGVNLGFNVAEATNFAVPEWIDYGKEARICMCRPDSVRIDMNRFEELLEQYEKDSKNAVELSYRQWALVEANRKQQQQNAIVKMKQKQHEKNKNGQYLTSEEVVEDQIQVGANKRRAFVIEVTKPVSAHHDETVKNKRRKKCNGVVKEEWRIAKPGSARSLKVQRKVLVLLPGKADGMDESGDEEHCFAGEIIEVADNCVRVHFTGLAKSEDVWIPQDSPKIFLDGGIKHYD